MTSTYEQLLKSDRISARTRDVLEARAAFKDHPYRPRHLSDRAFTILKALTAVVLPQQPILGRKALNLAARIDARLGGPGDGWRFAHLPPDRQAYELALCGLDDVCQKKLGVLLQDADIETIQVLLNEVEAAAIATEDLTEDHLRQWFSDLCADCVQIFISHPSVQAQLGLDAVFNGGDGPFQGFEVMGAEGSASWEPPIPKAPETGA